MSNEYYHIDPEELTKVHQIETWVHRELTNHSIMRVRDWCIASLDAQVDETKLSKWAKEEQAQRTNAAETREGKRDE